MAKTQEDQPPGDQPWDPSSGAPLRPPPTPLPDPDLLAAVVLDTLVSGAPGRGIDPSAARDGLTLAEIARACERDLSQRPEDAREINTALDILLADDLATREADRYRPTRAAIRAAELSF